MSFLKNYKHIMGLLSIGGIIFVLVENIASAIHFVSFVFSAFLPLILGGFIAFILNIIVEKYEVIYFPSSNKKWVRKTRSPVCTVLAVLSIVLMVGFVLRMAIPQTVNSIVIAIQNLPALYTQTLAWAQNFSWVADSLLHVPFIDKVVHTNSFSYTTMLDGVATWGASWASGFVATVSEVVNLIVNWGIGFFFAVYILLSKESLGRETNRFLRAYCKKETIQKISHIVNVIRGTFSSFFVGQFIDALILGIMVWVGMAVFGLPSAANIACVVGLTALIPLLGSYIGAAIGIIILITGDPINALIFLAILLVVQQIEGNFIYPKVVGNSVGLPGIYVFAAVVVGGGLAGVLGILFSVPIAAAAYKLLREDEDYRIEIKEKADE